MYPVYDWPIYPPCHHLWIDLPVMQNVVDFGSACEQPCCPMFTNYLCPHIIDAIFVRGGFEMCVRWEYGRMVGCCGWLDGQSWLCDVVEV